jgi:hypothetical protein
MARTRLTAVGVGTATLGDAARRIATTFRPATAATSSAFALPPPPNQLGTDMKRIDPKLNDSPNRSARGGSIFSEPFGYGDYRRAACRDFLSTNYNNISLGARTLINSQTDRHAHEPYRSKTN